MKGLVIAKKRIKEPSEQLKKLLRIAGSNNYWEAMEAQRMLAKALTLPLREGILPEDNISGIFEEVFFGPGQTPEWPKSFVTPTNQGDFIAVVSPQYGRIPQRQIVGDYVTLPTYMIENSIDASLRYVRDANWNVVQKMQQVLLLGHVRKKNDDGFHTLLGAAAARNIVVVDSSAAAGLFTKRFVSLMQLKMRRLGGGNAGSVNKRVLTDLYTSLENVADMRSWDLTQVDDVTRREIYLASDDSERLNMVFGVRIHPMDEFGVGQPYELYLENVLGVSLNGKQEFSLGLDLSNNDSFIMPIRQYIEVSPDPYLHRDGKIGWYSREEMGFGVLDNRSTLLGAN